MISLNDVPTPVVLNQALSKQAFNHGSDVFTDINGLQNLKNEKDKNVALEKVAQQFESMFIHMMLKSMRSANAVFEKDSLFNGKEEMFYRDMHDQQLSLTLAHRKGFGIAEVMYRQLSRQYGDEDAKESDLSNERVESGLKVEENIARQAPSHQIEPPASSRPNFDSPQDFVHTMLDKVKEVSKNLGIEPEYLVAQAALETGWGKHTIKHENGRSSNNFFNIKAQANWSGERVNAKTLEYEQGLIKKENALFRSYDNIEESINDYYQFLTSNPRYEQALGENHSGHQYMQALQQAGYATDPEYANKVTSVFNKVIAIQTDEIK